jgi:hypothetical protein
MTEAQSEHRAARNESAFRKVNEGIDAGRGLTGADQVLSFVCECGRLGCTEMLEVSVSHYQAVRSSGRQFIVRPDHVDPATERVVEHREGYTVTEKTGVAGEKAEELDPRENGD